MLGGVQFVLNREDQQVEGACVIKITKHGRSVYGVDIKEDGIWRGAGIYGTYDDAKWVIDAIKDPEPPVREIAYEEDSDE